MDLKDFRQQQREYPFLWYVQQFLQTQKAVHHSHVGLFIRGTLPSDEEFNDLHVLNMKAIVTCNTDERGNTGTTIIGSDDVITQLVWTLVSKQLCVPDEVIIKPGDYRIPMIPADAYESRKYLETVFAKDHCIRPVVFSKLYNGFICAEGIPQLKENFKVGVFMECQFLKDCIPYHINHTTRPYCSFDKESCMAVVKAIDEDDQGNKLTVIEFRKKEMQTYLPYPFEGMREVLYVNGVLVGAPANGRTLFVAGPE